MWARRCAETGKPPGGLRFFLDHTVITPATQDIVKRILNEKGKIVSPWPGYRVDRLRSDEFRAMVSSPHGYGLAFFLMDHRAAIRKKIRAVTILLDHERRPAAVPAALGADRDPAWQRGSRI